MLAALRGFERAEEFAFGLFHEHDLAADRRVLNVNINDREKNGDATATAFHEHRFVHFIDDIDFAVTGGNDTANRCRCASFGIAEKVESEDCEKHPNDDGNRE